MTQKEFAISLGKGLRTIQGWEQGDSTPTPAVVSHICNTYRVNEDWLFKGTGEMLLRRGNKNNSQYAVGNNIVQTNGGSSVSISTSADRVKEHLSGDIDEFCSLAKEYATPAMIKEWKKKLLAIKKLHED